MRGKMLAVTQVEKGAEGIRIIEKPIPEIGKRDVLIRVKAAGLCGSDLHIYRKKIETSAEIGVTIGHEFSGEVVEIGEEVKLWNVGDRVASDNTGYVCGVCTACRMGHPLDCEQRLGLGFELDGGFAEYVKIDGRILDRMPDCLVHIPDSVSYGDAAILDPIANGYNAVVQQGKFLPGESVAVIGAGPLGLACVNVAKMAGAAQVFLLVRARTSQLHREAALKMGADEILETESPVLKKYIESKTEGEGLACVYECAGPSELTELAVTLVRRGGKVIRVGFEFGGKDLKINALNQVVFHNIQLIGHEGYDPVSWHNCMKLLEAGMLDAKTPITHILPLTEYRKGVDLMLERKAIKVIYQP